MKFSVNRQLLPFMNLLHLLTKEKRVVGIEISDSVVRIAFFRPRKTKKHEKSLDPTVKTVNGSLGAIKTFREEELVLIEEPIPSNLIVEGTVADIEYLGKILKNIWLNAKLGTNYAIIAIPDDKIYSRIFSFPKSVEGVRLTEAMRLAIGFQLPMKTKEVYLDWERTGGTANTNEILLSTISRGVAEGYVLALEKAGIKTLAIESHLASIARTVKKVPGETTLFSEIKPDGATIFALKDGILRFSRTFPFRFVTEDRIPTEIKKVKLALEADTKKPVTESSLSNTEIRDDYSWYLPKNNPQQKWMIALGAAIRGRIKDGEDNLISLLPVGTEEAYAYQRTTTFIVLMRNLIIGVSFFFVAAYLSTYFFMLSLSQTSAKKITTLSETTIPPELEKMEKQIKEINTFTKEGASFLAEMPKWSPVLTEIVNRTPSEISISAFSAPNFDGRMSLSGVATNRTVLNNYKKSLQASPLLTQIELPLTNLEQKENIPFSASFQLKDSLSLRFGAFTY